MFQMANFEIAFEKTLLAEGGYQHTRVANDHGSETYAGISRRANPDWAGWKFLENGSTPPTDMVREIYRTNYWNKVGGNQITDQSIAETLYDFAVNAGVATASKLAQTVAGVTPDGVIGPKSIAAINGTYPTFFNLAYFVAKIKRYEQIVSKDRSQSKFLLGWVRRSLKGLQ